MATNKQTSLQSYIDKYLAEKQAMSNPKSYAEYIMHGGRGAAIVASEGKINSERNYSHSLSSYGKRAENLAEKGLLNSGYAKYFNDKAQRQRIKDIEMGNAGALSIEAENATGYTDYISRLAEEAQKKRDSIINKIADSMITDYGYVYDLALKLGLSENDAETVAKLTTQTAIKKLSDKAVTAVVDKRMSKEQAQKYAESLGLPEAEIEKIANYAEFINQKTDYSGTQQGYLDYIKDKLS